VIVVDGFVARRRPGAADEGIGGVVAERDGATAFGPAEILSDGFADEPRQGHPAAARLVLQLSVRVLGESQVRGDVLGHVDTTISEYRNTVNGQKT
jgi:hypothetical protein